VKIQIVISYVLACNKNKALQLQRVPILSILGYNIGSLAASGSTLLVLWKVMAAYRRVYDSRHQTANLADLYFKQALQFPKPKTKGRQI